MDAARQRLSRAVLWDMDGTLVDSADYHWQAWRDTMAREGHPITHGQFLATFGQRNDSILRQWLGAQATPKLIEHVGDAKEALYRQHVLQQGIEPLPGVSQWVRRLHQQGWRQAIASAAPRKNVETVLEVLHIADCFEAIVSAENVHRGKPDPEVFLVAAAKLNVPPSHCIVVEDALHGIEAARARRHEKHRRDPGQAPARRPRDALASVARSECVRQPATILIQKCSGCLVLLRGGAGTQTPEQGILSF